MPEVESKQPPIIEKQLGGTIIPLGKIFKGETKKELAANEEPGEQEPMKKEDDKDGTKYEDTQLEPKSCLLYTSPSPRDQLRSRMPSSA